MYLKICIEKCSVLFQMFIKNVKKPFWLKNNKFNKIVKMYDIINMTVISFVLCSIRIQ